MQQNIIWTNDTDQIDAIIDDWKQEAAHLATAMAENPKETMADATYGVDVILEKAWKYVVGECELPVPQRLVEAIESIDEYRTREKTRKPLKKTSHNRKISQYCDIMGVIGKA